MKSKKTIQLLLLKIAYSLIMISCFFVVFQMKHPALRNVSRTLAITLGTAVISFTLLHKVFGFFKIEDQESRAVISSSLLAMIFVDILVYIQLMIMNTNPHNNLHFKLDDLHLLFITVFLQGFFIYCITHISSKIYFKNLNRMRTLVIIGEEDESYIELRDVFFQKTSKTLVHCGSISSEQFLAKKHYDDIDCVLFISGDELLRSKIASICLAHNLELIFKPMTSDIILMSAEDYTIGDQLLKRVNQPHLSLSQRILKRGIDLILGLMVLFITLPLWVVVAIAIRIEDRGPVFFRQSRATLDGNTFSIYKFRTMKVNAPAVSAMHDDERITRVGHYLRKLRIDELPQLINIIQGSMSFVGPRPEMWENVTSYELAYPEFRYRLKVKAGLTGIAQIDGRYNTTPDKKLLMDLTYIMNYSLWLDLKLILRTFTVIFKKDSTEGF